MPVQTLCTSHLQGAPFPYRDSRPRADATRKLSAVERLEADKVKYVKSRQALSRPPPIIRKPLLPSALYSAPGQIQPQPTRRPPPYKEPMLPTHRPPPLYRESATYRTNTGRRGPSLDLGILNDLINVCDEATPPSPSPSPAATAPLSSESTGQNCPRDQNRPPPLPPRPPAKPRPPTNLFPPSKPFPPATPLPLPPSLPLIRRVDVRPQSDHRTPQRRPLRPLPSAHATSPCSATPPRHLPPSPALTRLSNSSSHRLRRSLSDLSDRMSDRALFFSLCGTDPSDLQATRACSDIVEPARASSDIVGFGWSEGEEGEEGEGREEPEEGGANIGRTPYSISVVERNARVIKWLYGIRQARDK